MQTTSAAAPGAPPTQRSLMLSLASRGAGWMAAVATPGRCDGSGNISRVLGATSATVVSHEQDPDDGAGRAEVEAPPLSGRGGGLGSAASSMGSK